MHLPDAERVRSLIERVAAEEMLPRFRRLGTSDVRTKTGPGDLVTIVDEICEARLSEGLRDLLPGSVVVGEEAAESSDAGWVDRLSSDDPVWIIDPLDGTYNYATGVDRFSSIVALSYRGETVAGWIHDPVREETGMAMAGEGAWIGSTRLAVAEPGDLPSISGAFSLPPKRAPLRAFAEDLRAHLARHHWLGSAGLDYLWLASGRAHVGVGGTYGRLKPWDHAAGVLMHREAGGFSALSTGEAYAPRHLSGLLIVAPDQRVWADVRHILAACMLADEDQGTPTTD